MTYYATNRTPPGPPRLVAFARREDRDGYVQADPGHRATVTVKEARALCKLWHGVPLEQALARGYVCMTTTPDTRPLSAAERAAIAQRYGVTCDLDAVTVCPAGRYSAELALSGWHAKIAKSKKRGLAKMQGKR